jgi:hypothetical protein
MMTERHKIKLFPGIGLLAAAAVLLAISLIQAQSTRRFVREAASAPGVVAKLNSGGAHPEIEFTTPTGEKVSFAEGGWISYKPGDQVRVLYRALDPHRHAALDDPGALWFGTGVTGLLCLGFVLFGTLAMLRPDLVQMRR